MTESLTMIYDAREFGRVRNPVLLMSAVTWILLLVEPGGMAMSSGAMPSSASWQMLMTMNPPASLAAGWVLMLVAMMSPVLIPPVRHIRLRSFTHRRARSILLFVIGYAAIWMAVGGVLLAIQLAVKLLAPGSYLPMAGVVLIASVWQLSPIKQRCINRCHAHTELAAFGAAADFDALRFGMTHGAWCAGSCWALMLMPLLASRGHVAVMAAVSLWVAAERLESPMPPRWGWRGPSKAARILVTQTRMRLQRS